MYGVIWRMKLAKVQLNEHEGAELNKMFSIFCFPVLVISLL